MCNYCGVYPYWAYSPFQYPTMYASYPSYGIPMGYVYAAPALPPAVVATPQLYYAPAPARGEYKTGNCLMICQ